MPAYLIIKARITDTATFAAYARQAADLVGRHGGRYRVKGGGQELLEGAGADARMVVSEWSDRAAALAFWHSPEYAAVKALRAGTGDFEVRLVEGVDPVDKLPQLPRVAATSTPEVCIMCPPSDPRQPAAASTEDARWPVVPDARS